MLNELRDCFDQDFTEWLLNSNCSGVGAYKGDWYMESSRMRRAFDKMESDSLQAILDILLEEPEADYFWYSYTKKLTYALPHHDVVASGSLGVNKERLKAFFRNIKINQVLQ